MEKGRFEKNEEKREKNSLEKTNEFYHDKSSSDDGKSEDRYYEVFDKDKPKKMAFSVASVAFALISVALCFLGVVGIILGVCSVFLALASRIYLKYFDKLSLIGIIVAIFGIVFGGVSIVWDFIVASDVILDSYYTIL